MTDYTTGYDSAIAEIERYRERIEKLKPHLDKCEEIRAMFPALNITVSCGYNVLTLQGALLMVHDLKDMKDILPVGRALTLAGYHTKGHSDYPELKRRTYNYGDIQLSAFLAYEGAACEFKQTGVKEEPVYELFCGEAAVEMEAMA